MRCPNCESENTQKSIVIETHQSAIKELNNDAEFKVCRDCKYKWEYSEKNS